MASFLASIYASLALASLVAAYLIRGRMAGAEIFPATMVFLVSLLAIQCLYALLYRVWAVWRGPGALGGRRFMRWSVRSHKDSAEALARRFEAQGYTKTVVGERAVVSRRMRGPLALEALIYASVLFAFTFGFYNFSSRVHGTLDLGASSIAERMSPETRPFVTGLFSRDYKYDFTLKALELASAGKGKASYVRLELLGGGEGGARDITLRKGESFIVNGLIVTFMGDRFNAFLYAHQGMLDLTPVPVDLTDDNADGIYEGDMILYEPNTRGEVSYDPRSQVFHVKLFKDQKKIFDRGVRFGTFELDGDTKVIAAAMRQSGTFEVLRPTLQRYMNMVVLALLALVVARIFYRPMYAVIMPGKDGGASYVAVGPGVGQEVQSAEGAAGSGNGV